MSRTTDRQSRTRKRKNLILDILIVLLVLVMVFCGVRIIQALYSYHTGTKAYHALQKEAGVTEKKTGTGSRSGSSEDGIRVNWSKFNRKYPDVKAWLWQKDTVINYPVAQSSDNAYYLHRLLNGKWNGKGTLFIDFRNTHPFTKDFLTIIYGHRMRDGSMFWTLADYRKEAYRKEHPDMFLSTPKGNYRLRIFAADTIPANSPKYQFDFPGAASRRTYLRWIRAHADMYDSGVSVRARDHIVMLSTCTYEFDNARAVVFAKLEPVSK
ncbi:class B sortase [Eubacterium pyruvativorans]|uniref:class B sortase n=1 Tax=Eubacterium pyruvativorans TaxID=155865 RepID=UPI001567730E|nr:class B sortase [Eubacterium pyruvativorans]